jgi:hypothetical protein
MPDENTTDGSSDQFIITVTVPKGTTPAESFHGDIKDVVKASLEKFFESKGLDDKITSLGVDCCPPPHKGRAKTPE